MNNSEDRDHDDDYSNTSDEEVHTIVRQTKIRLNNVYTSGLGNDIGVLVVFSGKPHTICSKMQYHSEQRAFVPSCSILCD